MQQRSPKQLYHITLEFAGGITRNVRVKAITREKAEERALKFHPKAIGVKRGSA